MNAPVVTRVPALVPEDAQFYAAARLRAARMQPYLADAVFALIPVSVPGYGTFGVDARWRVYLDMDQARAWGMAATAGVLLHETHHMVRDHHGRAERAGVGHLEVDRHVWNLAADAAINDDLVADDVALPDAVLPDDLGLPPHGFEETYYRLLRQQESSTTCRCGSGSGGEALPIELDDEVGELDQIDQIDQIDDIEGAAIRRGVAHEVAAVVASGGTVSPRLAKWASELLQPEVPWRTLLRAALGRSMRGVAGRRHPSWHRPDRRADCHPDVLVPGVQRRSPNIAVVADTSASMAQRDLDIVVTEIDALLHQSGVGRVSVMVCDNQAAVPQVVRRIGTLELSGGGGTDLRVGIAVAAELRPRPQVIVVLTDGLTPWPTGSPDGTTLICVVIGTDAPLPAGPGITSVRVHIS